MNKEQGMKNGFVIMDGADFLASLGVFAPLRFNKIQTGNYELTPGGFFAVLPVHSQTVNGIL